jgi:hypothetical protein
MNEGAAQHEMQLTSRTVAGRFSRVSRLHLKGGLQLISVLGGPD